MTDLARVRQIGAGDHILKQGNYLVYAIVKEIIQGLFTLITTCFSTFCCQII